MRKFLLVFAMISAMLFSFSVAQAATSALDNIPGGAGVVYWQAGPGGLYTLFNLQNVADNSDQRDIVLVGGTGTVGRASAAVHITFYDRDSNHLLDFTVPLSPRDNWGCSITGNGTTVTVTPQTGLAFAGYAPPATQSFSLPGTGSDQLQYGYLTAVITRLDNATNGDYRNSMPTPILQYQAVAATMGTANNANSNPWDDQDLANQRVVLPEMITMRAAVLTPDSAFGFNGNMIQGFLNIPAISELNAATFVNTFAANALCAASTVDWDGSGTFTGPTTLADFNGTDIQAPELYLSDNVQVYGGVTGGYIVADGTVTGAANCSPAGRKRALGSANGIYWGRYNVNPAGTPTTESTLLIVAVANSAKPPFNPAAGIADSRTFVVQAYDDNENNVSTTIAPPEVSLSPLTSTGNVARPGNFSIDHSNFTSGELRIAIGAPLFGYVYTVVGGVDSDVFPLIKDRFNIEQGNIAGSFAAPIATTTGVDNPWNTDNRTIGY